MKPGCYTAIVTPFTQTAEAVDYQSLDQLIAFQIENGISGILAVGTTGESPTLTWEEHNKVTEKILEWMHVMEPDEVFRMCEDVRSILSISEHPWLRKLNERLKTIRSQSPYTAGSGEGYDCEWTRSISTNCSRYQVGEVSAP